MNGDVIREFLVKLAYAVDEQSKQRFVESVATSTANVVKFAGAVQAAAVAVVAATARMAHGLEQVYFASRRTGAEAEKLMALSHAAKQAGVDVGAAAGSVEGLARFLRMNPGGETFLNNLGVQTRDAKGNLRDMTDLLLSFHEATKNMPLHQAQAYANVLGIDEATLLSLRNGELQKGMREYADLVSRSGVNMKGAAENSRRFMEELRTLGAVFDILKTAATNALAQVIGPQLQRFRDFLLANSREIAEAIGAIGKAFFDAAELVVKLGKGALDAGAEMRRAFDGLDEGSKTSITTLGLLLAAWIAFNKGILATPLGRVLALAGALYTLYEDHKTWREGGDSLLNWDSWSKELDNAKSGIAALSSALTDTLGAAVKALRDVFGPEIGSFADGMVETLSKAFQGAFGDPISNVIRELKNLIGHLGDAAHLFASLARGDWAGAGEAVGAMKRRLLGEDAPAAPATPQGDGNQANPSLMERARRLLPRWMGGDGGWSSGGSSGTPRGVVVPGSFKDKAPDVMDRLRADFNLTPEQAAGILGNLGQESRLEAVNEKNPLIPGSRGGFGWAQWTGPRRRQFEAWAAERGLDIRSDEANYGFLAHELRTTQSHVLPALRQARTADEATRAFFPYESGGDPRTIYGNRDKWGRDALAAHQARQAAGGAGVPTGGQSLSGALGRGMSGQFQGGPGLAPAGAASMGGGNTTIAPVLHQKTEIHVSGRADAQAVAAAQNGVNQAATRNLVGAVR